MLIQAAVSELAVKGFDECVLCWLSWLDEQQLHSGSLTPEEQSSPKLLYLLILKLIGIHIRGTWLS